MVNLLKEDFFNIRLVVNGFVFQIVLWLFDVKMGNGY